MNFVSGHLKKFNISFANNLSVFRQSLFAMLCGFEENEGVACWSPVGVMDEKDAVLSTVHGELVAKKRHLTTGEKCVATVW